MERVKSLYARVYTNWLLVEALGFWDKNRKDNITQNIHKYLGTHTPTTKRSRLDFLSRSSFFFFLRALSFKRQEPGSLMVPDIT